MNKSILLPGVDFGQPEAEHDLVALKNAFYEGEGWRRVISNHRLPFVVGRKGAGKSAIAARLEIEAKGNVDCDFLRIVPAEFRHVEIRTRLAQLVNKNVSWQYIYGRVWEGIILGQIVRHFLQCQSTNGLLRPSQELSHRMAEFQKNCGFYVAAIDDALTDVIDHYVRDAEKKTHELTLVELRRMLEPYNWTSLITAIRDDFATNLHLPKKVIIAIDGLDEHWDVSEASLFFLAQLLAVTKQFTAKLGPNVQFLVCLRDNIFRALVDTKSLEYDKLESLVVHLQWNARSLFELIARRVAPGRKVDQALSELRDLLPDTVDGMAIDDYIGRHILNRPRDYINFFRMLQIDCGQEPRVGEGHVRDTLSLYCANRLVDLENEFGFTYPGISRCIAALGDLQEVFTKTDLLSSLSRVISSSSFRAEAPDLIAHYGEPLVLARILVSLGVVGCYDVSTHAVRFVHEFSESRVAALWESADRLGIHPVYRYRGADDLAIPDRKPSIVDAPAVLTHPPDYLPSKDAKGDLESMQLKKVRRKNDLVAELSSIDRGQQHSHRWETWVRATIETCFAGDLVNSESQIATAGGDKRFEMIFDIFGKDAPWEEIKTKHGTHRLLVECKNTDDPTDADFSKLVRDMDALDLCVAILAYRGAKREPSGKLLDYQRSRFNNSGRKRIIVAVSEGFLRLCLDKKTVEKCRHNLNILWRDHLQRWLVA